MKKTRYKVGCKNYEMKAVSKPLIKLIVSVKNDLDKEINKNKKGRKKKQVSFVYASLELAKRIKK